jgi:hypothetical protein
MLKIEGCILFKHLMKRGVISLHEARKYIQKEVGSGKEFLPLEVAFDKSFREVLEFLTENKNNSEYSGLLETIMDKYYHIDFGYCNKKLKTFLTYEVKSHKKNIYHNEPMLILEITSVGGYDGWAKTCRADYFVFFIKEDHGYFCIRIKNEHVYEMIVRNFEKKGRLIADGREDWDERKKVHAKATFDNGYTVGRVSRNKVYIHGNCRWEDRKDEIFYYPVRKLKEMGVPCQCYEITDIEGKRDMVPVGLDKIVT